MGKPLNRLGLDTAPGFDVAPGRARARMDSGPSTSKKQFGRTWRDSSTRGLLACPCAGVFEALKISSRVCARPAACKSIRDSFPLIIRPLRDQASRVVMTSPRWKGRDGTVLDVVICMPASWSSSPHSSVLRYPLSILCPDAFLSVSNLVQRNYIRSILLIIL
ncbi:hypothetical protein BDW74DRAFT_150932 [Aspergillus multicolor]|uniref:uncharacterized protein n=1 Tax=Aspergillus multicolor TaxID=41759 RepID=UPI003CCE25A6